MLSLLVGSKDNILASSCWLNAAYAVFRHTFWSAFKHHIHVAVFSRAGAFKFISRTTTVNFSQQWMYNLHIILILLLSYFYFKFFVPL